MLSSAMDPNGKPLAWLHGEIKTPPFSEAARLEAGYCFDYCSGATRLECHAEYDNEAKQERKTRK